MNKTLMSPEQLSQAATRHPRMEPVAFGCANRWKLAILFCSFFFSGCLSGSSSSGTSSTLNSLPDQSATLVSLTVSPNNIVLLKDKSTQYTATGVFDNGVTVQLGAPAWSSSAGNVASINSSGLATGLSSGVTSISASWGKVSATVKLTVRQIQGGTIQGVPLSLTGSTSTFAGSGQSGNSNSTSGIQAMFNSPTGITTDGTNLYVLDANNQIRKIVLASSEVTLLGAGYSIYGSNITNDGTNIYATVNYPVSAGSLGFSGVIKVDIASGSGSVLAGSTTHGATDSAVGTTATFNNPAGITTDGKYLYVADTANNKIRQIDITSGAVTTLAGSGVAGFADATVGSAATFNSPSQITTDGSYLYVVDNNYLIRKISIATGSVSTITTTLSSSQQISGITTDGSNLYISFAASEILQVVIASGTVTTVAGSTSQGDLDATIGTDAFFNNPNGITSDGKYLYVADKVNNKIRLIQ